MKGIFMFKKNVLIIFFLIGSLFICDECAGATNFSVKPSYVVLDKEEIKIDLTSVHIHENVEYSILINGNKVGYKKLEEKKIEITMLRDQLELGTASLTLETDKETHTYKQAFTVVGQPDFFLRGKPVTKENILQEDETLNIIFPGVSLEDSELKIAVDGNPLEVKKDNNNLTINIPKRGNRTLSRLTIHLGDSLIKSKLLNIAPPSPHINKIIGGYSKTHANGMWIRIESNVEKPEDLTVNASCLNQQPIIFSFGYKAKEFDGHVYYCKDNRLPMDKLCTYTIYYYKQIPLWEREGTLYADDSKVSIRWVPLSSASTDKSPPPPERLPEILQQLVEDVTTGSFVLRGITFKFAAIRGGDTYYLGLNKEQRNPDVLAGFQHSSTIHGSVEIRLANPFLIQITEVTNEQYLPFLLDVKKKDFHIPKKLQPYVQNKQPLPEKDAKLPVTNISYLQALDYSNWLQEVLNHKAPGWLIRLPHEAEWEIAARKDLKQQQYTFPVSKKKEGLDSIKKKVIQEVGTNPFDQSWRGVMDLCGNVREWTASIYNSSFLTFLGLKKENDDIVSWDTQEPYRIKGLLPAWPDDPAKESHNMCVRGGANGENPLLQQISIRRQKEYTSTDDQIGFRLVIVKGKP